MGNTWWYITNPMGWYHDTTVFHSMATTPLLQQHRIWLQILDIFYRHRLYIGFQWGEPGNAATRKTELRDVDDITDGHQMSKLGACDVIQWDT